MNKAHAGRAATPPYWPSPKLTEYSSIPYHTPAVIFGVNPTNQASLKFCVVPVLPPAGCLNLYFHLKLPPVPLSTTDCNKLVTI